MDNVPQENQSKNQEEQAELESGYMQKPHMQKLYRFLMSLGMVIMVLMFAQAFIPIPFLAVFFNPSEFFTLPYNAIDFQKIAYIDNQFVMYGVDFDAKYAKQLVIFTSPDGKEWDKAVIAKVNPENESDARGYYSIANLGTFAYFNHQCMLIGAVPKILVSPDCHNWSYLETKKENGEPTPFWNAASSVVVNDILYVGTNRNGVYQSKDGIIWYKEQLPYPQESDPRNFENSFSSMATGNNKLIMSTNWMHDGKNVGLIYTKDLTTNKWSYEVYPVLVENITRGKDRFVAMTKENALVLVDGDSEWRSYKLPYYTNLLTFGYSDSLLGVSGYLYVLSSHDGKNWKPFEQPKNDRSDRKSINDVNCQETKCIGVGNNYYIVEMESIGFWHIINFNHENSKSHWWRRFF